MGATNRPQDLDSAILRRMPTRFHINQPVRDFQNKSLRSLKSRGRADGVFVPAEREAARADPRADPGEREGERTSHVTMSSFCSALRQSFFFYSFNGRQHRK